MNPMLSPSMMCCDFFNLRAQLDQLESARVELLHIDVMDGSFVPNIALGTDFVAQLKRATGIPLDLHFMVEEPERLLGSFAFGEGDWVSIHWESTRHVQRTLGMIRDRGAHPILAFNPATPAELAVDVLDDVDALLLMTVNPGFAGQKMIPQSIAKIARTRAWLDANGKETVRIEVDGNVSPENAVRMYGAGADMFVLGTSAAFAGTDVAGNIRRFRKTVFG